MRSLFFSIKVLLRLKAILFLAVFTLVLLPMLFGQNLSRVEYFFNTDPGFGNGITVPVGAQPDVTANFQAAINSLPLGFNRLYIRGRVNPYQITVGNETMQAGGWSQTQVRTFYKEVFSTLNSQPGNITKGEYFINNDPGFGNGTNISFSASADLQNISFIVPIGSLPSGFNQLYTRFRSENGWGQTQVRNFYKESITTGGTTLPNIVAGEYFLNTDPGFGNGTSIAIVPDDDLTNVNFVAPIQSLPDGFSALYVRFKDANGHWGQTMVRNFYKESIGVQTGPPPNLVTGEYFIDNDPGFGNGTPINFAPGANLTNLTSVVNITSVSQGFHRLYFRFRDAQGHWGHVQIRTFYKEVFSSGTTLSNIVSAEYFIDTDPGFGKGKPIAVIPGTDISNLTFAIDMSEVTIGNHQVYVRVFDANGNWSLTNLGPFVVEPPGDLIITVGSYPTKICAGSSLPIPFSTNAPFGSNNTYTVQLSNSVGNFSNPVNIGSLAAPSGTQIQVTIPANTGAGTGYRIRIIASSPLDTSVAGAQPITIVRVPSTGFNITGVTNTCVGAQSYASNVPSISGASFLWELSGGGVIDSSGPNATITWTTAGLHNLKLTTFNECGNGTSRNIDVRVFDGVPAGTPAITVSSNGAVLTSSLAEEVNGANGYQWYYNGGLIAGATNRNYTPPAAQFGNYSVRFTNTCGLGPSSLPYNFTGAKQNQTITFNYPSNLKFGDAPFVISATASSGLPVMISRLWGPVNFNTDNNTATITGAGTVRMRGVQQGNESFNSVTTDVDIIIGKADGSITISNLDKVFNGLPHPVTITTTPANLGTTVTYNGVSTIPVNAGTYNVVATLSNVNYQATANAVLEVAKASQSISLENISNKTVTDPPVAVSAFATSGLPVTIGVTTVPATGVASVSGNVITILGAGTVTVTVNQAGNNNFNAAAPVQTNFTIQPPVQKDLLVQSLLSPANSCVLDQSGNVSIRVSNIGSQPQSNFTVGFKLNGGAPVLQNYAGTLASNQSVDIPFPNPVSFIIGANQVEVFTALNGDERVQNDTITTSILRLDEAIFSVSSETTICFGQSVLLKATGGASYQWSNGVNSNLNNVSPTITTKYYVQITTQQGCVKQDSVTVNVLPAISTPVVSAVGGNNQACFGESVKLKTNYNNELPWFRLEGNEIISLGNFIEYEATVSGQYFVRASNLQGCLESSQTFQVNILSKPAISATPSSTICLGDNAVLSVSHANTFAWNTGETTSSITVSPAVPTEWVVHMWIV